MQKQHNNAIHFDLLLIRVHQKDNAEDILFVEE